MATRSQNQIIRPGYMRREDAAQFCGVSTRTLAEWQKSHLVSFIRVSHRVVLFKVCELERALDRLTVRASAAAE
jgi:predicted site-specific integrase-resolvase